ncbi:MAG TPA: ArsA-related P-loop ATPase [Acidimicrobiales bacterium]|nr:ArsA-related P-loop ATPase [Acidimicrobiales bacterium]
MDVSGFCRESHVVVVVGKGGVGKTTVTAALARTAANAGLDVLVVALDDSGGLPALFGRDDAFGYEEVVLVAGDRLADAGTAGGAGGGEGADHGPARVPGRVRGRVLTSDAALVEYLADHGLGRVSRRLVQSGALEVVATAIPGVREMLVLARLKQIERAGVADLVILDAPATGHAVTFLTSSGGLADAARGGPLRAQAEQVVEMLSDERRCQVLLVTAPEETPVNEVVETAYRLEDEVGVRLGPVVVNGCYRVLDGLEADPAAAAAAAGAAAPSAAEAERIAAAAEFRSGRQVLQRRQVERLAAELPLPLIELPYLFTAALGVDEVEPLAAALAAGIEALA